MVEQLYDRYKEELLAGYTSSIEPSAVLLGGQPASGKSSLLPVIKSDLSTNNILFINGDNYRIYHPRYEEVVKDPFSFSTETQIFSNVFTQCLINDAIKRRLNIVIEGTMRTPSVPYETLHLLKKEGYKTGSYVIASPEEFSMVGVLTRYLSLCKTTGSGRLSDMEVSHQAFTTFPKTLDFLWKEKLLERLCFYTHWGKELVGIYRDGISEKPPLEIIEASRAKQLNDVFMVKMMLFDGKSALNACSKALRNKFLEPIRCLDDIFLKLNQINKLTVTTSKNQHFFIVNCNHNFYNKIPIKISSLDYSRFTKGDCLKSDLIIKYKPCLLDSDKKRNRGMRL